MVQQYGISEIVLLNDEVEKIIEEVRFKGYSIIRNIISLEECLKINNKLEEIYSIQVEEIGKENLQKIQELDVVRCPLYYDEKFVSLLTNNFILSVLQKLFQNKFILHLQNGIINRPYTKHHQTSWHRDIPYQEYTTSKPLSINVFYCLSPFNKQTGATQILPYSHKYEKFPSINFVEQNAIHIEANPGDIVIFDSWLYHRATPNVSNIVRYGLNHVFTLPILKQQIDLPVFLNGKYNDDPILQELLGYTFMTPKSVFEYRYKKMSKHGH
ncbi:MAG: phytanoyl-CoA dioxygenase family protein [Candidatus Dojkabacteria bacterium]|nr:phytanoyl-CoA dioxygenase family protein [Candidatus Dojkabacteria bacterium]